MRESRRGRRGNQGIRPDLDETMRCPPDPCINFKLSSSRLTYLHHLHPLLGLLFLGSVDQKMAMAVGLMNDQYRTLRIQPGSSEGEDIFCNDLKDPSALDYSKPIFDWHENWEEEALEKWESIIAGESQQKEKVLLGKVPPPDFPHFEAVDMHKTRFCDLEFQLGAGYLYCPLECACIAYFHALDITFTWL
ncbi:hypothetical protein NE237_017795 [Protea cynaroides]|uniref:Uncharacterized protein n=1 Tax=Protea cynaroides TaxID=273540 RepID=A0A9Q0K8S8_9MAGN|nr:hypothetical protein NE237_017795 [Protea cynaroides]